MLDQIGRLVRHTVVYGLGNAGGRVIGFVLIPVYTRYLTPEDYGVLALVGLLGQILFVVVNMGQGTAVFRTYFAHDEAERRQAVVSTALWLILTCSFPVGLLALALAEPLGRVLTGSTTYTAWVMLGIGGVLFKNLLRLPFAVLRAREESARYTWYALARTATGLVLALLFVVGLTLGGRGVLLAQLLTEVLLCAALLPATLRGLPVRFSGADARDLLGYGIYQIPTGLFGFVLNLSDRYFLKHFGSLRTVGLYALGYRFGELLHLAMWAFGLAWPPFLFEHRRSPDAPRLYARVFTYVLAVIGFLWLAVSLLAEEMVMLMARPAFHGAARVVPWIAAAFVLEGLTHVGSIGLQLHRKVRYRPATMAATAALNVALNWVLVPRYDMMGAAVALVASYAAWFLLRALLSQRLYRVPYEYGRIARLAAVGGVTYALGETVPWGAVPVAVAGKGLLLAASPALLYASGFFEPGELRLALGWAGRVVRRSGRFLVAGCARPGPASPRWRAAAEPAGSPEGLEAWERAPQARGTAEEGRAAEGARR